MKVKKFVCRRSTQMNADSFEDKDFLGQVEILAPMRRRDIERE